MQRGFLSSYTGIIIVINIVVFVLFLLLEILIGEQSAIDLVALRPASILQGENLWTIITSMFMHAGLGHLFVNMVSLLFIGSFVERLIGRKRFLYLYLISGVFAGIFFVLVAALTNTDLSAYAVGASGAIFALGGLLAVLTPRLPVLVFFIIPMPMWAAMVFLIVFLWILSASLSIPIGNTAHLGGLLVGIAYGFYLKQKFPRRTKLISRIYSR